MLRSGYNNRTHLNAHLQLPEPISETKSRWQETNYAKERFLSVGRFWV